MKIIFLDVDGELTYSNYRNEETANIDIEKVKLLKEICDKTNAKVVISSSWKGSEDYTPKIYYVLREILSKNHIEVLGDTPHLKTEIIGDIPETINLGEDLNIKCKYGTGRAAEIQKWINEHGVENFVILDDEDWQWSDYGYENNWIQPTWFGDGGLKREHVDMAINILNK
ncbi:HAD domain-containing protein [Thomasclavelia cocleata]|uniref:HAD domain-containing protein n=1 Tax=Thomasclavelia cocleata TaxID=69824 RepID=UPI00255A733D|nr:HAD domain-containing protein [Thomasclavelia cocleata]